MDIQEFIEKEIIEKRELMVEEARRLVNSLKDFTDLEMEAVEDVENAETRAYARRLLLMVEDMIQPFLG